jgi:hypothetical protein
MGAHAHTLHTYYTYSSILNNDVPLCAPYRLMELGLMEPKVPNIS